MTEQTPETDDKAAAPSTAGNQGKLSDYLAHVEKADKARDAKDFATAITEYQAAALMRPNMFHPQMMLGKILYQQGMTNDAIGFLQRAHEMQPNNVMLLLHIAELLSLMGDNDAAQGVLCDALAVDDKNVTTICMLAQILSIEQKYDRAIELLQAAIEETPDEPELWRSIGDVMVTNSDGQNAKIFYQEALRLDPSMQAAADGLEKAEALGGDGANSDANQAEAVH